MQQNGVNMFFSPDFLLEAGQHAVALTRQASYMLHIHLHYSTSPELKFSFEFVVYRSYIEAAILP